MKIIFNRNTSSFCFSKKSYKCKRLDSSSYYSRDFGENLITSVT